MAQTGKCFNPFQGIRGFAGGYGNPPGKFFPTLFQSLPGNSRICGRGKVGRPARLRHRVSIPSREFADLRDVKSLLSVLTMIKFQSLPGNSRICGQMAGYSAAQLPDGFNPFQGIRGFAAPETVERIHRRPGFNPFQGIRGFAERLRQPLVGLTLGT